MTVAARAAIRFKPTTSNGRILVVEDEQDVGDMLTEYLAAHGYDTQLASDGEAMRRAIATTMPDIVLLDVNLPREDGLSMARWLRERYTMGIIMVTGSGQLVDRIVGLEVGADDYVAKPFDPRELLARVKSVMRRMPSSPLAASPAAEKPSEKQIRVGDCALDLASHQLFDARGEEIPLTGMEFDLLRVFVEHPNRVLSRDQLLTLTRNREWEPFDRSIDIRIARLRRKIESDPQHPRCIKTIRGSGYMFVAARS